MARKIIELTNQRFGRWIVLGRSHKNSRGEIFWSCLCDCGNANTVRAGNLLRGGSVSCGCVQMESVTGHGMTKTRTFKTWDSMKQRCLNPNAPDYHKYGGRGIAICERWLESFENFYADMGERPEGKTLDRERVNENYEPSNCRWATRSEQQRNKTDTIYLEFNGETKALPDWADLLGIPRKIIADRLRVGWSDHDALTKPNRKSKPKP